MSKLIVSKSSLILIAIIALMISAYPAFATEEGIAIEEYKRIKPVEPLKNDATKSAKKTLIQQKIGTKRENVTSKIALAKEKWASRAAELKTKLQTFKNQQKAAIAERINTTLEKINQNQTNLMKKHLETMSVILDKLESRVNSGTPDIKNPGAAKLAIATARDSIASASAAVTGQMSKDYTIEATSEATIRADAKVQRDSLHTDLRTVKKMVIDAKKAVANAIRTAKSGKSEVRDTKEGTASGE